MTENLNRRLAGAAVLTLLVLTGACSGGGDAETASSDAAMRPAGAGAPAEAPAPAVRDGVTSESGPKGLTGSDGLNRTAFEVRSVIRTGEVTLRAKDLDAARQEVEALLDAVDGTVESEQTRHDDQGAISGATLVLRVPVTRFADAMSALEGIGTTQHSDTSSEDVTTEVIDVDERVETLQNSLDRLQSYQAEAKDIEDLLRFEQQITQREAELQSLKAQQSYLADQTSMSTIRLTMERPEALVPPPDALDDAGFLAGLESGWNALTGAVIVVLTVLGAVLPFAVALALIGVPVWLLARRLVRRPGLGASPAGSGDPAPPSP